MKRNLPPQDTQIFKKYIFFQNNLYQPTFNGSFDEVRMAFLNLPIWANFVDPTDLSLYYYYYNHL